MECLLGIGLKQRMHKQLLWLMYIMAKDETLLRTVPRETRSG